MLKKNKLSTDPYKGVRDFDPQDMFIQKHIFSVMRQVAERFGYLEYGASPLEPTELYEQKSGQEIVEDQTYSFTDKGGRRVSLRPEMTPTVARMIAGRDRGLSYPARWYSLPNLFRYENPQRGRLREHFQLNADLFGAEEEIGSEEMVLMIDALMTELGAERKDFLIRINDRGLTNQLFNYFQLPKENQPAVAKLLDKKDKIPGNELKQSLSEIIGKDSAEQLLSTITSPDYVLQILTPENPQLRSLLRLIEKMSRFQISNIIFDPTLMRGFDYYTGFVFEVFDTHPDNRRSIFGGGRYDSLTSIFSDDSISAIGFGMGDVSTKNFLETHDLLPKYRSTVNLTIITVTPEMLEPAQLLAQKLRENGLNVEIDNNDRKIGDRTKRAVKNAVPFALYLGEEELRSNSYKLKNLNTEQENPLDLEAVIAEVKNFLK